MKSKERKICPTLMMDDFIHLSAIIRLVEKTELLWAQLLDGTMKGVSAIWSTIF